MTVLDLDTGVSLRGVHREYDCVGRCPIHKPSKHHMRDWPKGWHRFSGAVTRWAAGYITRVCKHGNEHPDPDSVHWLLHTEAITIEHSACCGCCNPQFREKGNKVDLLPGEADVTLRHPATSREWAADVLREVAADGEIGAYPQEISAFDLGRALHRICINSNEFDSDDEFLGQLLVGWFHRRSHSH